VEEDPVILVVTIRKRKEGYAVTIVGENGVAVDGEYYQPKNAEEVGKLVEIVLNGFVS
jgi:hypothetical protein